MIWFNVQVDSNVQAAGETNYFGCDGQDDALLKVAFSGSQVGKGVE